MARPPAAGPLPHIPANPPCPNAAAAAAAEVAAKLWRGRCTDVAGGTRTPAQIVAVEPHPDFAKIGQQLTSGMEGVTWRGFANASAANAGAEGAKRTEGTQGRGRLTAGYGELALGDFSPEEARKAAEQAEFDAARRRDADNPYARYSHFFVTNKNVIHHLY